jgi:Na+/H+-dicarboxylate symporter
MLKLKLHWQILIAIVLGIIFALTLTNYVPYVSWLGDLFLRALNMIIIPLVLSSLISGVANIGGERLGRVGMKTMLYVVITTLLAVLVGLLLVNTIQPGVGADLGLVEKVDQLSAAPSSFGEVLLKIIPTNVVDAISKGDLLAIIFFSVFFGALITKLEKKYQTLLLDFFNAGFEIMMKMTLIIIRFAPIGIFGIIAKVVGKQASNPQMLVAMGGRLGLLVLTVVLGFAIHSIITLPLLLKFVARVSPVKHYRNMSTALLTAFTTASSGATLPIALEAVENKNGVSNRIASFVLSLGTTVNMNGTALFECVGAIFIAQAYGIQLTFTQQFIAVIVSLLSAVGAPGIPMAGLVVMTIVLKSMGLPLEGVGLILAVERILDMFRTAINVLGDTSTAVIIAKSEGETLKI